MKEFVVEIIERTHALLQQNSLVLLAIDGRCAAGKTTLAAHLSKYLSCNVIHMDDFFLRPEQRTPERLQTPGGNVDHERFLDEMLLPLRAGKDFFYRPFDCHSQTLGEAIHICRNPIAIVEGSYSCHPTLKSHYDLSIFLSVEPEEQIRRIRQRNGESALVPFWEQWIPLEEAYFTSCKVR